MHYAILVNPHAGRLSVDRKRAALSGAAALLNAPIHGLDTRTREDFMRCARELTEHCDVLVVAGGDGSVSDVINAIDTGCQPIAYLPLGTGNALAHALRMRGPLTEGAKRIRNGSIRTYDLISCDNKARAFMASVGIDGTILNRIQRRRPAGRTGLHSYIGAAWMAFFRDYPRPVAHLSTDHTRTEVRSLLSLIVAKQPYYGFGMKVMPEARFDDKRLHLRCIDATLVSALWGGLSSFTIGNRSGRYMSGRQVTVHLDQALLLQIDGNLAWKADHFSFAVLPQALKIKF